VIFTIPRCRPVVLCSHRSVIKHILSLIRVEKAEEFLQDDGEVSKLEDECNWFRGETDRLIANKGKMQKDIKVRLGQRTEMLLPMC
jgi:hypothetical protein